MITVPVLATISFLPGMCFLSPVELLVGDGYVLADTVAGTGAPVEAMPEILVNFRLETLAGKGLADSELRGMPFVMRWEEPGMDALLRTTLAGMRDGGSRVAYFGSDAVPTGFGGLVPARSEMMLRVRVG